MTGADPYQNILLASLPRSDFEAVIERGVVASFSQRATICTAETLVDDVLFPIAGMISLLAVSGSGKAVETGIIGREGVFGAMAGFGIRLSYVQAIVQLPLTALVVPQQEFRKLAETRSTIAALCIRYHEVLLNQARTTAACNSLHPLKERFCRWLLQSSDRADEDEFALTQLSMSEMLGVRRTSVTEIAGILQDANIIKYSRGKVKILDRERLQATSCECRKALSFKAS